MVSNLKCSQGAWGAGFRESRVEHSRIRHRLHAVPSGDDLYLTRASATACFQLLHIAPAGAAMAHIGPVNKPGAVATDREGSLPGWEGGIRRGKRIHREGPDNWEQLMPLIESHYVHVRCFERFLRYAPLLHAPPAP